MSEIRPPLGSLAAMNLIEAGREKIIASAYMRGKIEGLAKKLVNLRYHGKKFNELDKNQQQGLREEAARMLNSMNGGKHRTRKTHRKRRYTSLKRK